ncbi:MAG: YciI family protein [Acidobacteria bacterium]|nr:YciI family protein [Acidobacteriota bacterium]
MKYVCCVYLEANALQGLSADERAELNRDSRDYDKLLAKRGIYIASSALQPARAAKTIRHRGGKPLVIDGPYAESKEVLGGFILIEVRNMEEAVQVAQNIPVGKFGNIEVRPEMKME